MKRRVAVLGWGVLAIEASNYLINQKKWTVKLFFVVQISQTSKEINGNHHLKNI